MRRKANGNSIEIQPGLYLSSHDGLLHCYFRIEGRAFRRSTRTADLADAKQRAMTWFRDAQRGGADLTLRGSRQKIDTT